MNTRNVQIAGGPNAIADRLAAMVDAGIPALDLLVNTDPLPDTGRIIARCQAFADSVPDGGEALIVTLLHTARTGADRLDMAVANGALWAFTRAAGLAWAPRRIRVNAIGLGADPAGPFEAQESAGRAAAAIPSAPSCLEDIARTLRAMIGWGSMTGQIVRLGAFAAGE
jgi:NAD(P)-dependent dehydrogenase (short-subunit alcohol dehydrogenase family)